MPKFCFNCGQKISDKVKFCPDCGAVIQSPNIHVEKNVISDNYGNTVTSAGASNNSRNLIKLSGRVSQVKAFSSTSGSISTTPSYGIGSTYVSGSIDTQHWVTFRVNNRPCSRWGVPNLSEGDSVVVVGEGAGELQVYAMRNLTTSQQYTNPTWRYTCGVIVMSILGLGGVLFIFSGLPLVVIVLLVIWVIFCLYAIMDLYSKKEKFIRASQMIYE